MPSSLVPRGDRVGARVTIAGRQVWLGTFRDADAALAAVARARGGNLPAVRTVAELAARWDELDPRERTPETVAHRAAMVAGFVRQYGGLLLESVSPATAQAWATARPGSVRYLRSMFETAVRLELLERNVWERVRVETERRPRHAFTVEEVQALADGALEVWPGGWGEEVRDLVLFTAYSGLRLSEVAAQRAVTFPVHKPVHGFPATLRLAVHGKGSKPRTVAVFEPGAHAFHNASRRRCSPKLRIVQADRPLCTSEQGLLLLFLSQKGKPLNRSTVSRAFKKLTDHVGLEGTFHSLRHFHGTWLLDQGASDIDVAVQLGHVDEQGHADATLVRKVYGHPDPRAALDRLEAITTTEGSSGPDGRADEAARGAGAA